MKPKAEMMKSLYRKRTAAGWHCVRCWTLSENEANSLRRKHPPPPKLGDRND